MDEKRYIKSFDSLKGIAVLLAVTIGHYWQFTPAEYWCVGEQSWFTTLTNGLTHFSFKSTHTLMELLLMISGFQLFFQYEKIAEKQISFENYIKKRIVRLFPMPVISTIVMVFGLWKYNAITGEVWHGTEIRGRFIVENLLNIQAWGNTFHTLNGPLWYVSVYFFCCILYFALVRIGEKINLKHLIMVVPILVGIFLSDKGLDKILLNADMCRGYIGFFSGVMVAYFVKTVSKKKLYYYSIVSIIGYIIFYKFCNGSMYTDNTLDKVLPVIAFFYTPLLILLSTNKTVDSIIGNKVLEGLGKISYSLYVWNFPFYLWVAVIEKGYQLQIPYSLNYMYWIMTAIQILIAIGSYFFIEKPIYKKLK